ncbi:MAG: hypothetical protein JNM94_01085 [Phycisphaerae bacterium]|nr:hypothetical protein [Phycisphaerae bacterium]
MSAYADIRDRTDDFIREHRKPLVYGLGALLVAALLWAAGYWWFVVRWKPPPSIFDSPLDNVLGYLALDDFSQMPLKDRVQFMIEFADRFRGLSQSDSMMMSGFLAGLSGPTREQLTQNARQMAKDILAEGAAKYVNLPANERAKFLDEWLVEWMKTGERIATGKVSDKPDSERVQDMRDDAQRDVSRERDPNRIPSLTDKSASRFLDFWSSDVEQTATPKEQGQITKFMEDLRKHVLKK